MEIFPAMLILLVILIAIYIYRKWQTGKTLRAKIRLEDALKHIYTSNKENTPATLNSIKGHQKISDKSALEIIADLLNGKLAFREKNQLFLTEKGKKYALNVIRNHRLWERFLADETGLEEERWHDEAEKMEHKLTEKERKELRKKLGNPLLDPHGDVIPGEDEHDYKLSGEPLSEISEPGKFKITHVEDEPKEIYKEILKLNLYPGMLVEITDLNDEGFALKTESGKLFVPKTLAVNLTVTQAEEGIIEEVRKLTELSVGEEAEVVKLSEKLRGSNRRRLLDLGIIPGSKIKVMYENVSGNPRAYEVKNTLVALRNDIADLILVKGKENA